MTLGQAKAKVRVYLDQHNYFSNADLEDSLRDGYNEIVTATGCIENVTEVQLVAGKMYYNLFQTVPSYYHTARIWSPTLQSYLIPTDTKTLDRMDRSWELWKDNPVYWFPHSRERIGIVPAPKEDQKVVLFFKRTPPAVPVDISVFNIPMEGQYLPEYFATADLLDQAQEYVKASHFLKQYQNDLRKQLKLMNRALPDQLVKLEG